MTRVRGFTQDDAHIFCTEEQLAGEFMGCLELVKIIFGTLGMTDYRVRVGLRDPDSQKYVGEPENWDKAEAACREAARTLGVPFSEEPGEAAFYGPKIDFVVRDVIGRAVAARHGAGGLQPAGAVRPVVHRPRTTSPHRPVMVHRAPFGSMERFVGVLIEHFGGAFPLWLSPEQVRVLPISEKSNDYAREVGARLKDAGLRAGVDDSDERIQHKIRTAAEERLPFMAVVGPRDAEAGTVSVRARGMKQDLGAASVDSFVEALAAEYRSRGATPALEALAPAGG